ncbi:MAG: hypothetical protein KF893_15605 [Caldilineaceae bacterium]|nr:hypothetical protein [Caldilineaceae bacterium]
METLPRWLIWGLCAVLFVGWVGGSSVAAQTPQPRWQSIDLGLPTGNAYSPRSLSVDERNGLAYVFSARVPESDGRTKSAVTVIKIASGEIVRRALIDFQSENSNRRGKLWISREGRRGFLLDVDGGALYTYNPRTDAIRLALSNVLDFALSPDEEKVVVRYVDHLAVYAPNLRTRLWRVFNRPARMAVSNTAVLVEDRNETGEFLTAYHMENGIPRAQIAKPAWIDDLAIGPDDSWFVGISAAQPLIRRLDADLNLVAEANGLTGQIFSYDAAQDRLLVSGYRYENRNQPAVYRLWALTADLTVVAEQRWQDWRVPNRFVVAHNTILGIREYDENDRLYLLDQETLTPKSVVALGVWLKQILLDSIHRRLYIADNQDQIHAIDLISGEILGDWQGMAPLAVDEANGRLYANRYVDGERLVVGLDGESGEAVATFPQGGVPAPDPNRDLVYIADGGVTVYNRNGEEVGRLHSTFPADTTFIPNPYTVDLAVNPATGGLIVFKNNGVPGSNNRNSAYVYPPPVDEDAIPADEPVSLPGANNVRTLVVFDRETGDFFLTYSGFSGVTAIHRIGADGAMLDQVGGRTGNLHYHAPSRSLYAGEADLLAEFDEHLDLVDFLLAPINLDLAVLDDISAQFYYQAAWQGPVIVHQPLNGLARLRWDNPPDYYLSKLPDEGARTLMVAERAGADPMLFVTLADGVFFQSGDGGQRWRQIYLGTLSSYGKYVTAAPDGALYYAGSGSYGGDGVFRSADGGEGWALMNQGLTQLQAIEPIQTVDGERLYLVSAGQRLYRWDQPAGHWTELLLPDGFYLGSNQFKLAPDGRLFLRDYDQLYRSDDHGQSWQEIAALHFTIDEWQFDPDFADNERIYAILSDFEARTRRLARSDDGGESWQIVAPGISISDVLYTRLKLFVGDGALFILEQDLDQLLRVYRSTDGGDTWQELTHPELVSGGEAAQLASGNRLWFIRDQRAVATDLDALDWKASDAPAAPIPTATVESPRLIPTPTSTPGSAPATPVPCAVRLDNAETLIREATPALGCPQGAPFQTFLARQPFEHGLMIWRKDTTQIYVLDGDGRWQGFADTWDESQPQEDPTLTPPTDRLQPVRGFGKLWREQLGGPQADIGWAATVESGADASVQIWSGGLLLVFAPGESIALLNDGRWMQVE